MNVNIEISIEISSNFRLFAIFFVISCLQTNIKQANPKVLYVNIFIRPEWLPDSNKHL